MDLHEVRRWLRDLGCDVEEEAMARFRVEKDGTLVGVLTCVGEAGVFRTCASLAEIERRCAEQALKAVEAEFSRPARRPSLARLL